MRAGSALTVVAVLLFAGVLAANLDAGENRSPMPERFIRNLAARDDADDIARLFRLRLDPGESWNEPRRASRDATGREAPRSADRRVLDDRDDSRRAMRRGPKLPCPPRSLDSAIAAEPDRQERRPSVAVRPRDPRRVSVAFVASPFPAQPGTRCLVKRSEDGGRTWHDPVTLPTVDPSSLCYDPVLAWSPDRTWLYAAYRNVTNSTVELEAPPGKERQQIRRMDDIVVSRSPNGGRTWAPPEVALRAEPWGGTQLCDEGGTNCDVEEMKEGTSYTWPGLAVSSHSSCGQWLYVTGTRFPALDMSSPATAVAFTRARRFGDSWSAPEILDEGAADATELTVQGARPAAGVGNEVLVAWYHSGLDGLRVGNFQIRVVRSGNHGASWGSPTVVADDLYEAPLDLGPLAFYKRWWTTMFPDLVIGHDERAHLVYTYDPDPGSTTAEDGDVRYVASAGPPYTSWSAPVTVNDETDGRAQGFPSVAARRVRNSSIVDVVWEDTRLAPEADPVPATLASSNAFFDIFHASKAPWHGPLWSELQRVSDTSSTQDAVASGGRTGIAATGEFVFAVWTDRRNALLPADPATDVYGSRVLAEKRGR